MKIATWLCAVVIAGLLCGPILACTIRTRAVVSSVTARAVVVTDTVVVPIAQFVAVPLYTASYSPAPPVPAPAAAPAQQSADTKAILDALKAIDGRLKAVESKVNGAAAPGPAPAPKAEVKPLSALSIFANRCAACHDKGVAAEKGGGLVLLDGGKIAPLTDRQARKVLSATYAGRMPPKSSGVSLTDEEVATVAAFLDSLK